MFHRNLRYYRLKNNMSRKELASLAGVSPMAISYYENGERKPGMETIKTLARILNVKVTDFLRDRSKNLTFSHEEFRKGSKLSGRQQDSIREMVEEYLNRFFQAVEILGGEVLAEAPACHQLELLDDAESNALAMRKYLHISETGPVGNLIELLENRGILICVFDVENDDFSGMNGRVNDRPYIVLNGRMNAERMRSTIAHEMAHVMFAWPKEKEEKSIENMAAAISGAFLFPAEDARRELGIRRTAVTKDMYLICREYGISLYLLAKRANLCGIIKDSAWKEFYMKSGRAKRKESEPLGIPKEEPTLFAQLVFRAVSEEEISVQKGAELLGQSYDFVKNHCFAEEG